MRRRLFGRWLAALPALAVLLAVTPRPALASGAGTWSVVYGGSGAEEMEAIRRTSDGGFLVAGSTDSFGDPDAGDAWVVKLAPDGTPEWQKTYGGSGDDALVDIRPTPDGGSVATGWTRSFGAQKLDLWVVKLDAAGGIEWQKAYGGPGKEQGWSVDLTSDGGYVVAGGTTSFGAGRADYWLLKLDAAGAIEWQRTYGGPRNDGGASAAADPEFVVRVLVDGDGNYVLASESLSFGAGSADIWVVKVDPTGAILWEKAYGGPDEDSMWSFAETADGGYLVPGSTVSFSPDASGDTWVLKLDRSGAIQWQEVLALPGDWDEALAIGPAADGGALVGSFREQASDWDLLLLRLDAGGALAWARRYEGGWDWPNAIEQTPDGGFAVAGVSWPRPADLDLWVLRLDAQGRIGASCPSIHDLGVTVTATGASAIATAAEVHDTDATARPTSATARDSSAAPTFVCEGPPLEDCSNGLDDDGDSLIDCADPDCLIDADGDGFAALPCGADCDDRNPAVHPGAAEICSNAIDDECDGAVDCADPECPAAVDADGDGFAAPPCGADCDDGNPAVHPGAAEICSNAIDDECDGAVDCADPECVSLPVCTLATSYWGRSVARFDRHRADRDRARLRLCVTPSFCAAAAAAAGDPGATLTVSISSCPPLAVGGDRLASRAGGELLRVRAEPAAAPAFDLRLQCTTGHALLKLRRAALQSCVANPVALTLSVGGTRSLRADALFEESRSRGGERTKLRLVAPDTCPP